MGKTNSSSKTNSSGSNKTARKSVKETTVGKKTTATAKTTKKANAKVEFQAKAIQIIAGRATVIEFSGKNKDVKPWIIERLGKSNGMLIKWNDERWFLLLNSHKADGYSRFHVQEGEHRFEMLLKQQSTTPKTAKIVTPMTRAAAKTVATKAVAVPAPITSNVPPKAVAKTPIKATKKAAPASKKAVAKKVVPIEPVDVEEEMWSGFESGGYDYADVMQ